MSDLYKVTYNCEKLTVHLDELHSSDNLAEDVKNVVKDVLTPNHREWLLADIVQLLNNDKIREVIKQDGDICGNGKDAIFWLDKLNAFFDEEKRTVDELAERIPKPINLRTIMKLKPEEEDK